MHVQCINTIHPLTFMAVPPRPWALASWPHAAQWWSGGGNNMHFVPLWACEIGHWLTKNSIEWNSNKEIWTPLLSSHNCLPNQNVKLQHARHSIHPNWSFYAARLCHNSILETQVWNCSHGTSKSKVPARLLWTTSSKQQSTVGRHHIGNC